MLDKTHVSDVDHRKSSFFNIFEKCIKLIQNLVKADKDINNKNQKSGHGDIMFTNNRRIFEQLVAVLLLKRNTESKNTRLVNMISLAVADHNKDLEGKAEDSNNSHQLDKTKEVQENHSTQQKMSTNDSADTEVLEDAIESAKEGRAVIIVSSKSNSALQRGHFLPGMSTRHCPQTPCLHPDPDFLWKGTIGYFSKHTGQSSSLSSSKWGYLPLYRSKNLSLTSFR